MWCLLVQVTSTRSAIATRNVLASVAEKRVFFSQLFESIATLDSYYDDFSLVLITPRTK